MGSLIVLLSLAATSLGSAPLPPLPCRHTSDAPAIDGGMGDACWTDATLATDFSVLGSGGEQYALRQTTVRVAWDQKALYLLAICVEPDPSSITANVSRRDGSVWLEDALELFLQPEPPAGDHYHFVLNARGVYYDAVGDDPALNCRLEVRSRRDESSWRLEIAIPWRGLDVDTPKTGDEWGFNVGREHRPVEPTEWSTWAPLKADAKDFHVPELLGRLRFAKAQPGGGRVTLLAQPDALVANPTLNLLTPQGQPSDWDAREHTTTYELASGSGQYAVRNDGDYSVISQSIDVPVKPGDVFTVFAVIKGTPDTRAGIAVVQEMEDGRPDDLYPFWNMTVTDTWHAYSGRIIVDPGAKRLKSAIAYRANRQGTVEYAYLQVRPGLHGVSDILEMAKSVPEDRRPIGDPWVTPHAPSYRPLAQRPEVLIFIGDFQRDVVEFAQRLDMDYDFVFCPAVRGGEVEQVYAWQAERVYRQLAAGEYDAIVMAGRPSAQSLVDTIVRAVEGGTGFVLIEPTTADKPLHPESYARLEELRSAGQQDEDAVGQLTQALPIRDLLTPDGKRLAVADMTATRHGRGRVAKLVWGGAAPGLIGPSQASFESHEYLWALLARVTLWAAGQNLVPLELSVDEHSVEIRAHLGRQAACHIVAEVDAEVGGVTLLPAMTVESDANGLLEARVPLPAGIRHRRGKQIFRARIIDGAADVVAFGAVALSTSPAATIDRLTGPEVASPGAVVSAAAGIGGEAGVYELTVSIVDAYDRLLDEAEQSVKAPGEVSVALQVRGPLTVYHRVVARLSRDGELLDERATGLCVPELGREGVEDFHLAAGYAAMSLQIPPRLAREGIEFLRANGVSAGTVDPMYVRNGFLGWGGTAGGGMGYRGASHVRERCFSDPGNLAALARETVQRVGDRRKWGWIGYNMNDEVHLHQDTSVEVCTSGFCTAAFRDWTHEQYGSVSAANSEWGTEYGSFDAVHPPLLERFESDASPARWVDFRLFMERVWLNAYAAARGAVREEYPEIRMSFTNPYRFDSLSGVDFHHWAPHEDILLKYMHPHVLDRYRSWSDAPMVAWFGYRSSTTEATRFLWWFGLQGGVMPIWWDALDPWAYHGQENYTSWNMLDPLWRRTPISESLEQAAGELSRGLYLLARAQQATDVKVVVLHSQPSMHVLYFDAAAKAGRPTRDGYSGWERAHAAFTEGLRRRGIPFRYVASSEVEAGVLDGVELLVLPRSLALSDETCGKVEAFVKDGGKLIADVMPATHTAHGRPRLQPALAAVLGQDRAMVLGDLNTDEERVRKVDAALSKFAPELPVQWVGAQGDLPADIRMLVRGDLIAVVRDVSGGMTKGSGIRVQLRGPKHLYDCRAGRYVGERRAVRVALLPGEAKVFAALPYRVISLDVDASLDDDQRVLKVSARVQATSRPGKHVLHVVTGPDRERALLCYRKNAVADGGRARVAIPFGMNEDPSGWKVWVTDVATGVGATVDVQPSER